MLNKGFDPLLEPFIAPSSLNYFLVLRMNLINYKTRKRDQLAVLIQSR